MSDQALPLSPPAGDGENTVTPAALAASARPAATRATAGTRPAAKKGAGATTSPRSPKRITKTGKPAAPPSEPPAAGEIIAPDQLVDACRYLLYSGAVEILYLRGAFDWQSAIHQQQADPGLWVLARWPAAGEPMDGQAAAYMMEARE